MWSFKIIYLSINDIFISIKNTFKTKLWKIEKREERMVFIDECGPGYKAAHNLVIL